VEIVFLSGHHTWDGLEETLMRSYAFICCHDHGDELRECSTCGPVILSSFTREIETQVLQGDVQCYACTCVGETPSELLLFLADGRCLQYNQVFPGSVRPMLSNLFGDTTLQMYVMFFVSYTTPYS
jgi:hypothetical protein